MNSIIRWAGSKRQLLSKLRKFWPQGTRYIEPFCGSACLFFDLEPEKAILGDLNSELITTYRQLKKNFDSVYECLRKFPRGRRSYYKIRATKIKDLNRIEIAARFLYLNKYCFNGIYRTNLKGEFNVPYGMPKKNTRFDYESVKSTAQLLKRATLVNGDFEATLKKAKRGDFVYLDPPYAVSNRKIFSEYQANAFALKDLARLKQCLIDMDEKGIYFLISYAESKEARELLSSSWKFKRVQTRRHIAGFVKDRKMAYEFMATNLEGIDL